MPASDDLISAKDAAALLQISNSQLHKLARSGALPTALKSDGLRGPRWFNRADVEALRNAIESGGAAA